MVVEVEVQVVVTYTVAACAAEAARRRVRKAGWRILVNVFCRARESFGCALCLFCNIGMKL